MIKIYKRWKRHVQRPTFRLRLALWSGGSLLIFSLGLVLFINLTATITIPTTTMLDPTPPPLSIPTTTWKPGQPTPTPLPMSNGRRELATAPPVLLVQQAALHQVRTISLIGLGLVSVLGGIGAYWLAGHMLRPLRQISQTAQRISADTLNTRLALDGPEDELKELADAFDAMLDRLERVFEQQGRFVADVAHELRTPLTTLRTNLEIVHADPNATLEDYREMATTLERALTWLERLVADLLLLAQEETEVVREEVALGPLLEDVLLDFKSLADEHQVTLRLGGEIEMLVRGDEPLLVRAFSNLIENGIRYNRLGGEVEVTLKQVDGWAVINVADTGVGISPEEQVHIFDRFYRVDRSRARHKGGTGLGLAIVTYLVQRHGGTVQVESTPGVGSTFTVRLPS